MLDLLGFSRWSDRSKASGHRWGDPVELAAPTSVNHPGWPEKTPSIKLLDASVIHLRPVAASDFRAWRELRIVDKRILRPVEPTIPGSWEQAHSRRAWWNHLLSLREAARTGFAIPFAIVLDGNFVGQVTLGNIQHGTVSECWIGYWVSSRVSGRGVATAACALGVDHAFYRVGLHRVTATWLPNNPASGAVLHNNGFVDEGLQRRGLHIDGAWQDHYSSALLRDDFPNMCAERLVRRGRALVERG